MLRYILSTASFKERLFSPIARNKFKFAVCRWIQKSLHLGGGWFQRAGKMYNPQNGTGSPFKSMLSTVIHFYGRFPLLDSLLHFVGSRQILVWKWARWIRGARIQSMPWLNTFVCAAQKFGKVNSPASIGPWKYRYGEEEGGGGRWMWWTLKTQNWRKHFVISFSKTFDQFAKPNSKT